jgi:hypothetical protein
MMPKVGPDPTGFPNITSNCLLSRHSELGKSQSKPLAELWNAIEVHIKRILLVYLRKFRDVTPSCCNFPEIVLEPSRRDDLDDPTAVWVRGPSLFAFSETRD